MTRPALLGSEEAKAGAFAYDAEQREFAQKATKGTARHSRNHKGRAIGVSACRRVGVFRVRGDHQTKMLRLVMESTKCTHLYHYYQHPEIGLMHIRVQTWFPFSVDVCLNGRQWLARQMDRASIDYQQRDNCFVWIKDCAAAQELLDEQLRSNWPALMNAFLEIAHPLHGEITAPNPQWETLSRTQCYGAEGLRFTAGSQPRRVRPYWHPQR